MSGAQGPVHSKVGVVVAGHPLAAEAGREALAAGGSATDALIASAAVLCVVLPQAVTLGGDAFGLFYESADATVHGLNASGRASRSVVPDRLQRSDLEFGARSPTVPALVRGWDAAHRRFGKLAWSDLFAAAIAAAENGVPVSRILASAIAEHAELVARDAGLAALLIPSGRPLIEGDLLRQPQLAESFRAVAQGGADAFYGGAIALSLAQRIARDDGLLSADDFARCAAEWVIPISADYRGNTVATVPPNSFGLLGLLQLTELERQAVSGEYLETRLAAQVAAAERTFVTGAGYLADPEATGITAADLRSLLANPVPNTSAGRIGSGPGGTAVAMAVDRDGNAALIVQSIFTLFGSGVLDAETGILLNNRMRGFSLDPSHPNVVAAGKRPAHTLSPMMVLRDGRLRLVLATPGGLGQTPTLVQVIDGHIGAGLDLETAIARPRWSYDLDQRVIVEAGVADDVVAAIAAGGVSIYRPTRPTPFFGSVKAIRIAPDGTLCGVADRRRDGAVAGI
ncbi:gamma-glutamyltransferase [Hyphomicrobium sp. LHD-15]|uniref:gamma-glutamyltransferase family protein n=1 Tax=Hyphomicrobium sp. LHD-15 TaxID=3072142 RepID=UPI00280C3ED3|nr:gamma-glutamyltransferase [Hyphomicrobium sp. LHD-15]MDQ8697368.1 gamma-glutamyltransferase [Hyphomicrobium sp. LHD-15]